ncbi:Adk Adenylate kinase and related kinases [Fimbriimonadaceae bacterium]
MGQRIWIRGTTGSGKSTLAKAISDRLGIAQIELDDLWHLPGWQVRPREEFFALLEENLGQPSWVISGNYSVATEVILPKVTMVVWLDYSRGTSFWRLFRRTVSRVWNRKPCCNGNYESLWRSLSLDSILVWHLKTYSVNRKRIDLAAQDPAFAHCRQIVLHNQAETDAWLNSLGNA